MKKNAYHYLFGQDTLYQAVDPEPVLKKQPVREQPPIEPEPVVEQAFIESESTPIVSVEPAEPEIIQPVVLADPTPPAVAPIEPASTLTPIPANQVPESRPAIEKPKVLILIDEELTPGELIFLENILKAIQLNLNDIDILNLAGSGLVDFHAVLENKVLHHFISFGVPFKTIHLNLQMDRYDPIRIFGITFLLADPLSAIEADSKLKRKLWEVLKKVFLD
ncbi:hypothetical protein [Larkinella rosea]|uniref:Uncharacterized protein n=1 Tax=Larkinella rosea TaxID=2025312 RepID=A0A3P1BI92_9BACT|nr:hypothetical protein [Larkinella rosea]RRB00810.1 hypothetical protein EHT25_21695 [Larkinella rosea]